LEELIENVSAIKDPQIGRLPTREEWPSRPAHGDLRAAPGRLFAPLFRTTFFYPLIMQNTAMLTNAMRREADLKTLRGCWRWSMAQSVRPGKTSMTP